MVRAAQIEKGEIKDPAIIKRRRQRGIAAVKALQQRVAESYKGQQNE